MDAFTDFFFSKWVHQDKTLLQNGSIKFLFLPEFRKKKLFCQCVCDWDVIRLKTESKLSLIETNAADQ